MDHDRWVILRGIVWTFAAVTTWICFLWVFYKVTSGELAPGHQVLPLILFIVLFAAAAPRRKKG